jgi:hypothetical protein
LLPLKHFEKTDAQTENVAFPTVVGAIAVEVQFRSGEPNCAEINPFADVRTHAKIANLDGAVVETKNILRLDVTVNYSDGLM